MSERLPNINLPDFMMKALDQHGICSNWIAGDHIGVDLVQD